jgi:hypothetical protein
MMEAHDQFMAEINNMGSYPDFTNTTELSLWPWDLDVNQHTGVYTIPLSFRRRGSFYVQIYLSEEEYRGGYASTEGKIQASGLVIRIE